MGVLIEFGGLARSIICEEKKSARSVLLEQGPFEAKGFPDRSAVASAIRFPSPTASIDSFSNQIRNCSSGSGMGLIAIDGLVGKVVIGAWNV